MLDAASRACPSVSFVLIEWLKPCSRAASTLSPSSLSLSLSLSRFLSRESSTRVVHLAVWSVFIKNHTKSSAPSLSLDAPLSGPGEYPTPAEVEDLAGNWVDVEWWVTNVRAWLGFSFERRRAAFGEIARAMFDLGATEVGLERERFLNV